MLRLRTALSLASACLGVHAIFVPHALAASPGDSASSPPAASEAGAVKRAGFEILAVGGWGESTADVRNLEMQPYGASAGLDLGYAFRSGFRLGANVGYGAGRTVHQRHDGFRDDDFDVDAESSSVNFALTLGYDVPLSVVLLRYSLGFGATFMRWDLGEAPAESVWSGVSASSPTSGAFIAPGVALLLPHGLLQCGVGFDYLVQANGAIPPAFLGKLLVGVKL
ncbi:MAG TPA: hypothetical protein VFZ53_08125 [Polyangiaceae bacterium]